MMTLPEGAVSNPFGKLIPLKEYVEVLPKVVEDTLKVAAPTVADVLAIGEM